MIVIGGKSPISSAKLKGFLSIKLLDLTAADDEAERSGNNRLTYVLLAVFCFFLMLFCTKSSPLFAFNDWFDANVYFNMGKGLVNGRVPYVDFIDNKGPLLYLI